MSVASDIFSSAEADIVAARTGMSSALLAAYAGATDANKKRVNDLGLELLCGNSVGDTIRSFAANAEKSGVPSVYACMVLELIPTDWNNSALTNDATRVFIAACMMDTLKKVRQYEMKEAPMTATTTATATSAVVTLAASHSPVAAAATASSSV